MYAPVTVMMTLKDSEDCAAGDCCCKRSSELISLAGNYTYSMLSHANSMNSNLPVPTAACLLFLFILEHLVERLLATVKRAQIETNMPFFTGDDSLLQLNSEQFDFSVQSEQLFFTIIPSALFIVTSIWRTLSQARKAPVVNAPVFQLVKVV